MSRSNNLESSIQSEIIKYLEAQGHFPIRVSRSNVSGMPDLIACIRPAGLFMAIEVKRPGDGVVSALQSRAIRKIIEIGGRAIVAYSVEDVKKALTETPNRPE